jgi:carboxylesterase
MHWESLNQEASFDLRGEVGCILLHGFTGSPAEMQALGHFLAEQQITVSIPVLPGHGQKPEDLLPIKWTDWVTCVREELERLQSHCRHIFVAGQSMGGTLALHLATHQRVDGIITYAAPVTFAHRLLPWIPWIQKFYHYYPKKYGTDVRDPESKARLKHYPVYPLPAILEFQKLIQHTFDDLNEITAPLCVMHSRQDHTIMPVNAELIMNSVRSLQKEQHWFQNSYHLLTVDVDKDEVQQFTLDFMRRYAGQEMRK